MHEKEFTGTLQVVMSGRRHGICSELFKFSNFSLSFTRLVLPRFDDNSSSVRSLVVILKKQNQIIVKKGLYDNNTERKIRPTTVTTVKFLEYLLIGFYKEGHERTSSDYRVHLFRKRLNIKKNITQRKNVPCGNIENKGLF